VPVCHCSFYRCHALQYRNSASKRI
jgi:hypothetical protein